MISEKQFISNYDTFWRNNLPLSRLFLLHSKKEICLTKDGKISINADSERRFFTSQISFYLFESCLLSDIKREKIGAAYLKAKLYFENNFQDVIHLLYELSDLETRVILETAKRLKDFFTKQSCSISNIIINPKFVGCGIIDSCYGDVIVKNTIYEVKMVNRKFQQIDYRQIIVYCALNSISNHYDLQRISLFNPLSGEYYINDIDEFCFSISGKSSTDLFDEIIKYISSGNISK